MVEVRRGHPEPIDKHDAIIRFKVPLIGVQSGEWKAAFRQCIDLDLEFFEYRVRLESDHLVFECEEMNVEYGVKKVDDALAVANKAASQAEEEQKKTKEAARKSQEEKRRELERLRAKFKDS